MLGLSAPRFNILSSPPRTLKPLTEKNRLGDHAQAALSYFFLELTTYVSILFSLSRLRIIDSFLFPSISIRLPILYPSPKGIRHYTIQLQALSSTSSRRTYALSLARRA